MIKITEEFVNDVGNCVNKNG